MSGDDLCREQGERITRLEGLAGRQTEDISDIKDTLKEISQTIGRTKGFVAGVSFAFSVLTGALVFAFNKLLGAH